MRRASTLRKTFVAALAALLAASSLGAATSRASSASAKKHFVTIPIITSLSGPGATYGAADVTAYRVAAAEINAKGGIYGWRLQFKVYDTQSSPTVAAELVRSVGNSALVIAGPALTNDAKAMFPVAKSLQVPILTGSVSDASVVGQGQPWAFDMLPPAQVILPTLVKKWVKKLGLHKAAMLFDSQNAATALQGGLMQQALQNAHVDVVKSVQTTTGTPSYQSQAAAIADAKPQAVAVCGLVTDAAAMVHALRAAGVSVPILLCMATASNALQGLLGNSVANVYIAWPWYSGLAGKSNASFVSRYSRLSGGQTPTGSGPSGYAVIKVIAQALQATHVLTKVHGLQNQRNVLRKYISKLRHYHGVNGIFSMSSGGYFVGPGTLLTFTNGQITATK